MKGFGQVLRDVLKQKKEGLFWKADEVNNRRKKKLEVLAEYRKLSSERDEFDRRAGKVRVAINKLEEKHGVTGNCAIKKELENLIDERYLEVRVKVEVAKDEKEVLKLIRDFRSFDVVKGVLCDG